MREGDWGSSLRPGRTAVSDRLTPIIIFSAGRERRNGVPKHLFRHAQQEEGLWLGGWDEVTMRLLLYSLPSVMVLFTPELLRGGLTGNVQSRRLLINAVSGFWQHKQTVTQFQGLDPMRLLYQYGVILRPLCGCSGQINSKIVKPIL